MHKTALSVVAGSSLLASLILASAFEAHVVNVTANIENALEANTYLIDFGTVFPQEKFDKTFGISMSESFLETPRMDDVEYVLRQKPKCRLNEAGIGVIPALPSFGQAKEDANGHFVCKDEVNYDLMPFLCPYLSKEEMTLDGTAPAGENDSGPLSSFHGPIFLASSTFPSGWSMDTTKLFGLNGRLAKSEEDTSDTWNIDLKVPCFGNHCAQDWADFFMKNGGADNQHAPADAADYIQPLENEHLLFGCDLWLEVTGLSTTTIPLPPPPPTEPPPPPPPVACDAELDMMLVLDRSGSISSSEMQSLKDAAHAFVSALNPSAAGVHVGQSSFAFIGSLDLHLTDDEAAAHLAISNLSAGGTTDLEAGITLATNELDDLHEHERPAEPDALVIITDGAPNVPDEAQGAMDAANAADAARAAGIEVFVVGVGVTPSAETFLKDEVADDTQHYFAVADFADLEAKLQELVACESNLNAYNFEGVTTANHGTGGNPIAFENDSDLFPWTASGDQNTAFTPSDAEYTAFASDDGSRWSTADPGGNDIQVVKFGFFLTESIVNITDIKILWKGNTDADSDHTMWLHKTGLTEFATTSWSQLGSALSIPADSDRYIVRHLSSNFATYVDGATGEFTVAIRTNNDSEVLRTNYVQLLVTSNP